MGEACKRNSRYLPLSTTGRATPRGNLSNTFSEEKEEVRDPDSDVEARQDFWSIMGIYIYMYVYTGCLV